MPVSFKYSFLFLITTLFSIASSASTGKDTDYLKLEKEADSLSLENNSLAIQKYEILIENARTNKDVEKEIIFWRKIGLIYIKEGDLISAKAVISRAITKAKQVEYHEELGVLYNNLAAIHYRSGEVSFSLRNLQLASEEFKIANLKDQYATTILNTGILYRNYSIYDKATSYFYKAIEFFEKEDLKMQLASAYNSLANVRLKLNDTVNTLELFQKSLKLRIEIGNSTGIAGSYNNIGEYYTTIGKYDSAQLYYQKALDEKLNIGDENLLASTYTNIADIKLKKQNFDDAIIFLKKSLDYSNKAKNDKEISEASTKLAKVYLTIGDDISSSKYQKAGENSARNLSNLELLKDNLKIKIELLKHKGLYKEALEISNELINVKDEILNKNKNKALTEMQIKYEVEQQKKENTLLQEETKRQQAQLEAEEFKNLLSGVIIAGLVLLSAILYIVFRQFRRHNKLLKALLNEQQHRVKNFLQTIGGIFRMHARKAEHEEVKAAVKEGSDRLEAMMLIHKQLYQPSIDAPASVNFTQFTQQLIKHISSAYAGNNDIISPQMDLDEVDLDVNKAVALGLILNEVVNNSFKYAIPNTDNPTIEIRLKLRDDKLKLVVADNGPGLPEDSSKFRKGSLGMNLIKLFSKNLNATYEFKSNNGAHFEINCNF